MVALKENCIDPKTQKPYIKSTSCGEDNSIDGMQVRAKAHFSFPIGDLI